jgi:hypothetical protein
LARFKPSLSLVDDKDPAFAANEPIVAVPTAQRFERITNFHGISRLRSVGVFHRVEARTLSMFGLAAAAG